MTPAVPDTNLLDDAVTQVRDALEHGDPIAIKHLLGRFIHQIEISTDWQAHPTYLIPKTPIPEPHATRGSARRFVFANQTWRWRESNPRPSVLSQFFSGRSLLWPFSAPAITQTSRRAGLSHCSCRIGPDDRAVSQWPPDRRQHPGRRRSRADAVGLA
jgi:hypothetical protein